MTHTRTVLALGLTLLLLAGCGGKPTPPPAPITQASGEWVGWLSGHEGESEDIVPIHLKVSQLGHALNVAATLQSKRCFGISTGVGTGVILDDHTLTLTLKLNDGGTLVVTGTDETSTFMKGHLAGGTFTLTGGECPTYGTVVLDRT